MKAQERIELPDVDTAAVLAYVKEWAAPFHDDFSPAQVTDVLVGFAFVMGMSLAMGNPAFAAALLRRLEEEMPSASESARATAQGIVDSLKVTRNGAQLTDSL
ncbi:MAG: hypothetical protein V3S20_03630 [Dehalococcoidia bacterium]